MEYAEQNHYDQLSKFETLKEFNDHFEQAMLDVKEYFTKSEYIALNKLRKFAANVVGVAWVKGQKAVASTHKDSMFGISRSTFDRMLRKAKKIGLVSVFNQFRENKYQKHNVYVFNRLEEIIVPESEVVEIVSKSHTIDEPENVKIDEPLTKNLSNLSIKKQVKDNNNTPVRDSEEILEIEEQREYVEKYATNEYQTATFKLIESMPMSDEIKSKAHIIALRVGSNATITDFVHAKSVLLSMSVSSVEGNSFGNVVAVFTKAYEQRRKYAGMSSTQQQDKSAQMPENASKGRSVPFYNWLKERSHASGRAVYNWITN